MNAKTYELSRRYFIFILGLFFGAMGISLITKAGLGTSAISSFPYVMTYICPFTLGQLTLVMNAIFVLIQVLLLRKAFEKIQWLQLIVAVLFSGFLDFSMSMVPSFSEFHYIAQLCALVTGCATLGLGLSLEVAADVLMVPGDAIVRVLAKVTGKEFGIVKTCFDCTLVISSITLALVFMGTITGLREGTVVAALTVGTFARLFGGFSRELVTKAIMPPAEGTGSGLMSMFVIEHVHPKKREQHLRYLRLMAEAPVWTRHNSVW